MTRFGILSVLCITLLAPGFVNAEPILQLYIQGATYNNTTETWVFNGNGTTNSFNLWVIGNTGGGGSAGPISNVQLAAAYPIPVGGSAFAPIFTFSPTTTGGFAGFTDPSVPVPPTFTLIQDGGTPTLSDGSSLPSHGIYGSGTEFQQFGLGNFTLTDSPLGDFSVTVPAPSATNEAQINVYTVTVNGLDPNATVNFDAFDEVTGAHDRIRAVFAPFSHTAEATNLGGGGLTLPPPEEAVTPEPSSVILLGLGTLFLIGYSRRR